MLSTCQNRTLIFVLEQECPTWCNFQFEESGKRQILPTMQNTNPLQINR